jgi:hypothetical protein
LDGAGDKWARIFGLNWSGIFGWSRSQFGWNWGQMVRIFCLELKSNGLVCLDGDGVKLAGIFGMNYRGIFGWSRSQMGYNWSLMGRTISLQMASSRETSQPLQPYSLPQ